MTNNHLIKHSIKYLLVLTLLVLFYLPGLQYASAASEIDFSEPVKLSWYIPGIKQTDSNMVETAVNKYLKTKINATLKLTTIDWSDYQNKMYIMMASGEPYDINFTSNWMVDYKHVVDLGLYTDITDMIDDYAPKTKAFLGENILKGAEVAGRLYAIPTYNESTINRNGILLNKKLVQKYKVDTTKIKKLQDLEAIFTKIKAKEPKVINFYPFSKLNGNSIIETLNYDKLFSCYTPGAVIKDGKSTKVINNFDTADTKSLLILMNKWYKKGYISKSSDDYSFFNLNSSKIFSMYSDLSPTMTEDLLLEANVEMIPIQISKPSLTTISTLNSMQAISYTSKNPERALMLLELVNTDEKLSNMLNFGIEGVHYKKSGSRTITRLPAGTQKYDTSSCWMFGNQTITYSLQGHNPKVWDKYKDDTRNAIVSPLLGFSFNSEPVDTIANKLKDIVIKYYRGLSMGKTDPNVYLPKMNNELKKAGLDKFLTEMQKQVDIYIKENK